MNFCKITVHGIVQGVGFRPFIYRLARANNISGYVANTTSGVVIEAAGSPQDIDTFLAGIGPNKPPLARIDSIDIAPTESPRNSFTDFAIKASDSDNLGRALITPDTDACDNCLRELFDPSDRRYLYPFINCTDCGPRYTLIRKLPYDRRYTSMAPFPLCSDCQAEYEDPRSRRFHAEATTCPVCGPQLTLTGPNGGRVHGEPVTITAELLQQGKIIAIKGIGGFHLAVDAGNAAAIERLRELKGRPSKAFAVMSKDLQQVRTFAEITENHAKMLQCRQKAILLLPKTSPFPLAANIAPGNRYIGTMLPYTPLHHLIMDHADLPALVMTSGNLSGEPIVKDNREVFEKLGHIADYFLLHDRDIVTRTDDSVIRLQDGSPVFLRRARGYVPAPVMLARDCGHTFAVGGNIKNTFCLSRGREAFVSQHIGDLDRLSSQDNFAEIAGHMQKLLEIEPTLMVCDLHPDYPSTIYAESQNDLPTVAVQHHHAHAVSCMAENNLDGPVIAITLDGSGLGTDNTVWGGEILLATPENFSRRAHLKNVGMPGGETAVKEPWRMAFSHLYAAFGAESINLDLPLTQQFSTELPTLLQMLEKGFNSPATSSCGRLFDAISSLLGLCHRATYEGQAAIELEMKATGEQCPPYDYDLVPAEDILKISPEPMIRQIVDDLFAGQPKGFISLRFHTTVAAMFAEAAAHIGRQTAIRDIVLSGGSMQNNLLTSMLKEKLTGSGFAVYQHRELPPNDGCLSLGQLVAGRAMASQLGY